MMQNISVFKEIHFSSFFSQTTQFNWKRAKGKM